MNKDKSYGLGIMLAGIFLIIVFIFWGPVNLYYEEQSDLWGNEFLQFLYGDPIDGDPSGIERFNWRWALMVPITLIIIVIGLLTAWIGYSMFTTPPPVPLEDLEEEIEKEELSTKDEEKKQQNLENK